MTDRELLELAARAIGTRYVDGESWDEGAGWNPLEDDGDALRLATRLGIAVTPYPIYSWPKHSVVAKRYFLGGTMREANPSEAIELHNDDPCAATRRAIVRAAAALAQEPTNAQG